MAYVDKRNQAAYGKEWYAAHKLDVLWRKTEWVNNNKEHVKERERKWYKKNIVKQRLKHKKWMSINRVWLVPTKRLKRRLDRIDNLFTVEVI